MDGCLRAFLFLSILPSTTALADTPTPPAPGQTVTVQVQAPAPATSVQSVGAGSGGASKPQVTSTPAASTVAPIVQVQQIQTQQQKPGELSQGNEVGTVRYALHATLEGDSTTAVCIPPDTPVVARPHPGDSQHSEIVIDNGRTIVFGIHKLSKDDVISDCDVNDKHPQVNRDNVYLAPPLEVTNSVKFAQMVMGVLVVPFKYYVNGDRSFVGNPSLAGYIGSRVHDPELAADYTLAVIAGVATVSVSAQSTMTTTQSNTSTTTTPQQTAQGFTIGLGEFFSFGSSSTAQAGFMIGQDYVSKSANWVNNGKMWVALDIAYQFY